MKTVFVLTNSLREGDIIDNIGTVLKARVNDSGKMILHITTDGKVWIAAVPLDKHVPVKI